MQVTRRPLVILGDNNSSKHLPTVKPLNQFVKISISLPTSMLKSKLKRMFNRRFNKFPLLFPQIVIGNMDRFNYSKTKVLFNLDHFSKFHKKASLSMKHKAYSGKNTSSITVGKRLCLVHNQSISAVRQNPVTAMKTNCNTVIVTKNNTSYI